MGLEGREIYLPFFDKFGVCSHNPRGLEGKEVYVLRRLEYVRRIIPKQDD